MRARPWRWWLSWLIDVGLTAVSLQLALVLTLEYTAAPPAGRRALALLLAGAHAASLVLRRVVPRFVAAWLVGTAAAYAAVGLPPSFLGPAGLVGLYTVAVRTPRTESVRWLAATELVVVAGGLWRRQDWDSAAMSAVLLLGAWVIADQVRRRQDEAVSHAARAEQLELAREELAEYAVTQERLRIARELHDVLAHSMSVVALTAGAGRVVARDDPQRAHDALRTIEVVTREAMAEMRQLTAVLRDGDAGTGLTPLPGLADLPALVARVADAGLTVDVRTAGERRALPGGLDLTLYRIIQEALTNTLKHSQAQGCSVLVEYEPDHVAVSVTDHGPATDNASPGTGGSGLVGMRERVAMYGGTLAAGPTADGFRIRAELPTAGAAP